MNEKLVLNSQAVKAKLKERGVATLKADWTNQDEKIAETLKSFGRSGVPLYLVYKKDPKTPPKILPQILTPALVLKELDSI
jgi:thiol:disulfide interchange protein DsbD